MKTEKISQTAELVIFDFYGTLAKKTEERWELKENAFGLIARLKLRGKKIAVSSGSSVEEIRNFPRFVEIGVFVRLYGEEHLIWEESNGYRTGYKDLGKICSEFGVKPERAVMIGDRGGLDKELDKRSAERFKIDYIEVVSNDDLKNLI